MTDYDPYDRTARLDTPGEEPRPDRPGGGVLWKVLTGVFAVAAVGLAIWAFALDADAESVEDEAASEVAALEADNDELTEQVTTLEDEVATLTDQNAALADEVATLEEQNAGLQQQSEQLSQDAQQAIRQALAALGDLAEQQAVTQQQVTDATAALDAANTALAAAEDELSTAQAEREQALALAELGRVCASGAADALGLLGDGDVDGAVAALTTVAPACDAASAAENQPQ